MYTPQQTESKVSLKLCTSHLLPDAYVARVSRNTVNTDTVIAAICDEHPGLDPYVIAHAADLLKNQILKTLKIGKAVNVLDLGTVYIAPCGTVPKTNPQITDLPDLTVKWTPSKITADAVKGLSASSFMIAEPEPQISDIVCLKDGNTDGNLYRGFGVVLEGNKLKVSGEGSGIFFVPQGEDATPNRDESQWIRVDTEYLPTNTAKTVQFSLPDTLQAGTEYYIAVRTSFLTRQVQRKKCVTGFSLTTVRLTE